MLLKDYTFFSLLKFQTLSGDHPIFTNRFEYISLEFPCTIRSKFKQTNLSISTICLINFGYAQLVVYTKWNFSYCLYTEKKITYLRAPIIKILYKSEVFILCQYTLCLHDNSSIFSQLLLFHNSIFLYSSFTKNFVSSAYTKLILVRIIFTCGVN